MACQRGRGTDDALSRFKVHLSRYWRIYGDEGWVLKCDIHHFFPTTPHKVVKQFARKYISDTRAADMVCRIIDSFPGEIGLGLGSQISQIMELLVLNELDHFIKERLHIKYYIRYMDDFILIHPDKEYLEYCLMEINKHVTTLGLELNKKTTLHPLKQGIIFLKWHYYIRPYGRIVMKMDKKKVTKQKKRMKKILPLHGEAKVQESLTSFLANAKRGNTHHTQYCMEQFYCELTGSDFNERKLQKTQARRGT